MGLRDNDFGSSTDYTDYYAKEKAEQMLYRACSLVSPDVLATDSELSLWYGKEQQKIADAKERTRQAAERERIAKEAAAKLTLEERIALGIYR